MYYIDIEGIINVGFVVVMEKILFVESRFEASQDFVWVTCSGAVQTDRGRFLFKPIHLSLTIPSVCSLQYDSAEWEPAFLRQAREFLFFPLLLREASK